MGESAGRYLGDCELFQTTETIIEGGCILIGRGRKIRQAGPEDDEAVLVTELLPMGAIFAIKDGLAHRVFWHEFR
jgi:hypothetical protein